MAVLVHSYTIYHSPNAYLGTVLLRRALAGLPGVELVRRPFYIPREHGLIIADLLGGKENRNAGSYNREDCRRWSERYAIPMSYPGPGVFHERAKRRALSSYDREELPARAFYAADPEKRGLLDQALFEAAWVAGLRRQRARDDPVGGRPRRARPRSPDDPVGRAPPGRRGARRSRRVRAAAMPRCPDRRRRPALLRERPGRLGYRFLPRRCVSSID
jgi:hypothetical protein